MEVNTFFVLVLVVLGLMYEYKNITQNKIMLAAAASHLFTQSRMVIVLLLGATRVVLVNKVPYLSSRV